MEIKKETDNDQRVPGIEEIWNGSQVPKRSLMPEKKQNYTIRESALTNCKNLQLQVLFSSGFREKVSTFS